MKRLIPVIVLALVISVPALAGTQIGDLSFTHSFDTLSARAQMSQKAMVIKFYTDW
jgi:hypothetical protein